MKKTAMRRTAWAIAIISTVVTVFLSLSGYIPSSFTDVLGLLFVMEGTALIELTITEFNKRLNEPTIMIQPLNKLFKIGFSVRSKDRSVNDAMVICNDIPIKWEDFEGNQSQSIKLQVGASPPAYFFPFRAEVRESGSTEDKQYIIINLLQERSKHNDPEKPHPFIMFDAQGYYEIPKGAFDPMRGVAPMETHFEANIRITGDEIGEAYNRVFDIFFWPVFFRNSATDKLEDIELSFGFALIEKRFLRKKKYDYDYEVEQLDPEMLRYNIKKRKLGEWQ